MPAKKKRHWLFAIFIAVIYLSFMGYFCFAKPTPPTAEQTASEINQVENPKASESVQNPVTPAKPPEVKPVISSPPVLAEQDFQNSKKESIAPPPPGVSFARPTFFRKEKLFSQADTGLDLWIAYFNQTICFYQQMMTLLLGIIGALLVVSFIYLQATSKVQAEEMASEALEKKSFQVCLEDLLNKKFLEFKNSEDVSEVLTQLPELMKKIEFLEKTINASNQSKLSEKPSKGKR